MGISGKTSDSGMEIFGYDKFNRLTNYNSGANEATYTYDADNLRASKTVDREKTTFVWNGSNLANETTDSAVNTYTYDATGVYIANQNGTVTSYLKDMHGNIAAKADSSGAKLEESYMNYDAYGNQWQGNTPDPFGYCGEYYDEESGLIYLRNRYYESETGRFITEDPAQDGTNWYSYCAGNPVVLVDPSGCSSEIPEWLDWDGDGRIDTTEDRSRFDSNNNGIADWREYYKDESPNSLNNSNMPMWYQCRNVNMLSDYPYTYQGNTNFCWAVTMKDAIEYITGKTISEKQILDDRYEYSIDKDGIAVDYNSGSTLSTVIGVIEKYGYLDGSGYEIDSVNIGQRESGFTFDFIKNKIDDGMPILLSKDKHVYSVIGYAYDDDLGKKYIICYDSSDNQIPISIEWTRDQQGLSAYSFR
ncbi:MAG: RHS repeat-associated core domain-containing protein [Firmicutes bacterium]|nr:RHS repeat-associated core domain-containing protein [Bacillota bacterium]